MKELRQQTLNTYPALKNTYFSEYVEFEGVQNYLKASQNYSLLLRTQSNSYKCFLTQAWMVSNATGTQGFLHPEGTYDDPKGGLLRATLYQRLRYHFQFQNELLLFSEIHDAMVYSVNVYGASADPAFCHISNLYHPSTIDVCFTHDGAGLCGGIKDNSGNWNVAGHRDRIIEVNDKTLRLFSRLYDPPDTPALEARLPSLHSRTLLPVLYKFAEYPMRLGNLEGQYDSTVMWDETNRVNDGTIRRETRFPTSTAEWVVSGPHIEIATPFSKTPRRICAANGHYDPLDLTVLPECYLPRTNYVPACDSSTYLARTPRVPWGSRPPVTNTYRVHQPRDAQSGEGENPDRCHTATWCRSRQYLFRKHLP